MSYAIVNATPSTGRFSFSKFHETEELAIAEAKRLCENENGLDFIVLQVIGRARKAKTPVEYITEKEN